jgi:mono/diheme cytochrome c family protein
VATTIVGTVVGLAALALVALLALAAHRTLPERPAGPLGFDAATVRRGAALAAVGNCASCHTASFGAPYAGGVAFATPFGTIHGTNITPDIETGIGRWTETAFVRAMREGVDREGKQLYPAFPYDHFTRTNDDDLHALYAFVMTRDAVRAANVPNTLRFPFGFRPLLAGWNLLFLNRGPQAPADRAQGAAWNRGAYLVHSLAHCGSCHTPRNALGAEERGRDFAGGDAEGWYAPALDERSPSPLAWTADELTVYLRTGIAGDHAIAGGPMQEVVASLARAPLDDVRAIATYFASRLAAQPDQQARAVGARQRVASGALASARPLNAGQTDAATLQLGRAVYVDACAGCHDRGREISSNGALQLPLAIAVYDPDPRSLLRIVRDGIVPPPSELGRFMPAFGTSLSDEQLVALLTYLRTSAADAPPWPDLAARVRDSRQVQP